MALVAACHGGWGGRKPAPQPAAAPFPRVEVPGVITDPVERNAFLAEHFWDRVKNVPQIDTVSLEEAVGLWATLLNAVPPETGKTAVIGFLGRMETLPAAEVPPVLKQVERYLYDPNSPVRNEDLYGVLSDGLATAAFTPDSLRVHYGYLAGKCAMNAVGTRAADFLYTERPGRIRSLYSVEAEHILLVFGNPECTACRELHAQMENIPGIPEKIAEGKLAVLEVNPDTDAVAKAELERTYHIRAIPSVYLLDKDKTVLLKDAPVERALQYLNNL